MSNPSGTIGTVAIWSLGLAPVLAIYHALRGEVFSRTGQDNSDAKKGTLRPSASFSSLLRGTSHDAYKTCFQWLRGYDISPTSKQQQPLDHTILLDSDKLKIDIPGGQISTEQTHHISTERNPNLQLVKSDINFASPPYLDNGLYQQTKNTVEGGDAIVQCTFDSDYGLTAEQNLNLRRHHRNFSGATMSTDEGIDTDFEQDTSLHRFQNGGPEGLHVDQADSGFPGNSTILDDTYLYSTPTHLRTRRTSETNSDIISQHLEELSGIARKESRDHHGKSLSMGDLRRVSSFKEAGDIALSHTDILTLTFEDEFEISNQDFAIQSESDSDEFTTPNSSISKSHSNADFYLGNDYKPTNSWSDFLHIVDVSGEGPSSKTSSFEANSPKVERRAYSQEKHMQKFTAGQGTHIAKLERNENAYVALEISKPHSKVDEIIITKQKLLTQDQSISDSIEGELFSAIESGEIFEARKLIRGANQSISIDGISILHQAAIYNMAAVIPALFYFTDFAKMMDVPVNNRSSRFHGYTAMEIAQELQHQQVVDTIDEYHEVEQSLSDLHRAARAGLPNIVKSMCKEGAEVNKRAKLEISPLYCACTIGRLDIVKLIASFGGNLGARNDHGDTLLHRASQLGYTDIAEYLITRKYDSVDINANNEHEETPLHKATYHEYVEMVEFLLHHGAAPNAEDDCSYTPLHIAACNDNKQIAKLLLHHSAVIDACDANHWTPLHCSSKYGHLHIVELLLQNGASVYASTKGLNNTALHIAVENGHHDVAELLIIMGADIDACNAYGHTPLHIAAIMNDCKMADLLIEKGADIEGVKADKQKVRSKAQRLYPTMGGKAFVQVESVQKNANDEILTSPTPLHFAAKHDSTSVLSLLIGKAADVDAKDNDGKTPLHYAAEFGHFGVVEILVDHGATIDCTDNKGRTPLHYGSVNGHAAVVDFLLAVGASVQATTERRHTPLHCAANKGHVSVVEKLVEKGAGTTDKDVYNWTPLHWAAAKEQHRTLKMLIEKGANVNGVTTGTTPLHVAASHGYLPIAEQLIASGSKVNAKDQENWTPLHHAANEGHLAMVKLFRRKGARVCEIDSDGKTPLHCASMKGSIGVMEFLLSEGVLVDAVDKFLCTSLHVAAGEGNVEAVKFLISQGADVSARDDDYLTPLHYAAKHGRTKVTEILAVNGALVDAGDAEKWTPLHFAAYNGENRTVQTLIQKGADIEALTAYHNSHLHLAAMRLHAPVVDTLLNAGIPVDTRNKANLTALILVARGGHVGLLRKLLKHGANVDVKDSHKRTPLHFAAEKGHLTVVGILLDHGIDTHVRDRYGDTALHLALKNNHHTTAALIYETMRQSAMCRCSIQ
ncbi:uncharacterized protein LOC144448253 [Glandiceps talaboti]